MGKDEAKLMAKAHMMLATNVLYGAGYTWPEVEEGLCMKTAGGMNAWRASGRKHKRPKSK